MATRDRMQARPARSSSLKRLPRSRRSPGRSRTRAVSTGTRRRPAGLGASRRAASRRRDEARPIGFEPARSVGDPSGLVTRRTIRRRRSVPVTMRRWRSTSSAAPPPSPGPNSCSSPIGRRSSSTAACSRAARTSRSATGSRSDFDPATLDAMLLTHAHLDHCGLIPLARQGRLRAARSMRPRARSSSRRSCSSIRASCTRSSPSARRAGRSATPTRPWPTTAPKPTSTARRSRRSRGSRTASHGQPGTTARRARADQHGAGDPTSAAAWPATPRRPARAAAPICDLDLDAPLYTEGRARRSLASFRPVHYGAGDRGRARDPRARSSMPATSSARRSSGCGSRPPARRGADHRVLGRSRPARHADPARPHDDHRRGLRPGRIHVWRPRARAEAEAIRILAETVRLVAGATASCSSRRSRSAGPRRSCGSSTGSSSAARSQLLPLYLDSPMASKASDIYRRHPDYYDEETAKLPARRRTPLDYPNQTVTDDVEGVADDRARASAVHDRRLERHADRRPRRRPPPAT